MKLPESAQDLLAISEAIQRAAMQADWIEAARLSQERSPLLMSFICNRDNGTLNTVRRIQAIDESVLAMAATGKDRLYADYRDAIQAVTAAREYQRVAQF